MTYLTHDPVTKATYRVHNGRGVVVGSIPVQGEKRLVRFRLASGEAVAFEGVVQDLQEDCTHPWKHIETTFGGGIVCMKCRRLI